MSKQSQNGPIARLDAWLDKTGEKLRRREFNVPIDLLGGVLFLLAGIAILLIIPEQITVKKKEIITGRQFPSLLAYIMIGCSLILILREIFKLLRKGKLRTEKFNLLFEVRALIIFADMVIYYLVCKWTDSFVIGSCVFAVLMLFYYRCKKWHYYAITLAAAALIWAAFRFGLSVRF